MVVLLVGIPNGTYRFAVFFTDVIYGLRMSGGYWGQVDTNTTQGARCVAQMLGNSLTWYHTNQVDHQYNETNREYYYIAIG